jgi:antitoxin MazE
VETISGSFMIAKIQKWGNSLAIRIPKSLADEIKIKENTKVDLAIRGNELVIKKVPDNNYTLKKLLKQVNEKNIHYETDFGQPSGQELL